MLLWLSRWLWKLPPLVCDQVAIVAIGAIANDADDSGTWLIPWQKCLTARQHGLVPSDEQVWIYFGIVGERKTDRWCFDIPLDRIALREAPMEIVAGIDCTVYFSGDGPSFGLISGLCKRLIDSGPRRLQLIDVDQAKCIFLRLAVDNG